MDGVEALPLILRKKRDCAVIMASTLTRRNAEISLRCLTLGALDSISEAAIEPRRLDLGRVPPRHRREGPPSRPPRRRLAPRRERRAASNAARASARSAPMSDARPFRRRSCALSGHGAAPARHRRLDRRPPGAQRRHRRHRADDRARAGAVTQHMPATFTTILAEHLARASGGRAAEASRGRAGAPRAASMSHRAAGTCARPRRRPRRDRPRTDR